MMPQGATAPAPAGGASAQQMEYMQRAQMEYMQRLQYAQAQAAMARSPYPQMQGYGGYGMGPQAGYGGMGKGGDAGFGGYGGGFFEGKGKGKKGKGKGKGKGKFKGKGKGEDGEGGDKDGEKKEGEEGGAEGEAKEKSGVGSIVSAQREARQREEGRFSPIVSAQRDARMRFEKDVLDRIQGRWVDETDSNTTYVVEGNVCSVSSGDGGRGFRNRLSVYGVEMCWDARRFWHYLNLQELYAAGDNVEKLEWNPAKDSPPTQQIVWLKAPPLPEGEEEAKEEDEAKEEEAKEGGEEPAAAAEAS